MPRLTRSLRRRLPLRTLGWGALCTLALASAGWSAWAWKSGKVAEFAAEAERTVSDAILGAGFSVQEVLVIGRRRTPSQDVLDALAISRGDPILAFDPAAARSALEALPWVLSATVERQLPDRIRVRLVEREPLALWQHERSLRVIDAEGVVVADRGLAIYAHLPLVVGEDAPAEAADLLALLTGAPAVAERIDSAIRVGGRRWDLELDNGVTVKLPEDGVAEALRTLTRLQAADGLFDRDVRTLDLRLGDRLVIELPPGALDLPRPPGRRA